jgi:hypothetical protein
VASANAWAWHGLTTSSGSPAVARVLVTCTSKPPVASHHEPWLDSLHSGHRRGGARLIAHRVGRERLDLGFGEEEVIGRMQAVETGESNDPRHSGALGMDGAVMPMADLSRCCEQFGGWLAPRITHMKPLQWCPELTDNRHWAKQPENPANIKYQGKYAS